MERILSLVKKQKINLIWIALSIYSAASLCYLLNLMSGDIQFSFSCLAIGVYVVVFWLMKKIICKITAEKDKTVCRRRCIYSVVFGSLVGISYVMGYQLAVDGITLPGVKGKLFILFIAIGIGIVIGAAAYFFLEWLDKVSLEKNNTVFTKKQKKVSFFVSWAVIFVAWIPVFLAYYPAIMSYDCHRQFQEAIRGYIWFNSHHPLVHTFLIRMFLLLGEKIGSYEVGMALFSLLQMSILSVIYAYACNMVGRLVKKKWAVVATAAFFALVPIHPVMALSITKDVLFTAFFLLLVLLILEHNQAETTMRKWFLLGAMLPVGILVMLFRNNAIYAFAVFTVFYFFWAKKERIKILVLCVAILLGGKFSAQTIHEAMDAGTGSKMEMFSVFTHQMTRVGIYQRGNLELEDLLLIEKYIYEKDWPNYNPTIADGIKHDVGMTTFDNWKDDIGGMLKDWFMLGIKYPNDYIDAFLALTSGYWFLDDVSHAEVLGYGDDTNLGLLYTFNVSNSEIFDGVESRSYIPWLLEIYKKIVNGNEYYDWPVLNLLYKPAFYCWALFSVMYLLAYKKEKRKWIICLFPLIYLATLLLGPVVNFRYVYPIAVVVPILIGWLFSDCEWKMRKEKYIVEK